MIEGIQTQNSEEQFGSQARTVNRMDAKRYKKRRIRMNAQRFDSVAPGQGVHLAKELEHVYSEVLREQFPPQSAFEAFEMDQSVPEGARTHTIRRRSRQGDVRVYRGNSKDIPNVSLTQDEETFKVQHYITGIELDFFEQKSNSFAGTNVRRDLEDTGKQALLEFANDATWHGLPEYGLPGVLNYPYSPKMVSAVTFSRSTNPEKMYRTLNRMANANSYTSKNVYSPNRLLTSKQVRDILYETEFDDGSGDSVAERFLRRNEHIDSISTAHELRGAGENGEDCLLFYRRDRRSIANVIPKMPTMLPVQKQGFKLWVPIYMTHGGVVQRDPLNNLVAYADTE